jgi:hypothetical protein
MLFYFVVVDYVDELYFGLVEVEAEVGCGIDVLDPAERGGSIEFLFCVHPFHVTHYLVQSLIYHSQHVVTVD